MSNSRSNINKTALTNRLKNNPLINLSIKRRPMSNLLSKDDNVISNSFKSKILEVNISIY